MNEQERTKKEQKKCKRLIYEPWNSETRKPSILLGIITEETKDYVKFLTRDNEYSISRKYIIIIKDTDTLFDNGRSEWTSFYYHRGDVFYIWKLVLRIVICLEAVKNDGYVLQYVKDKTVFQKILKERKSNSSTA